MLTIRKDQIDALSRAKVEAFIKRLAGELKLKYPARCANLSDGDILESVRTAMAKGAQYRFETEECVALYLDLMYRAGFNFDGLPWARETLRDLMVSPSIRLLRLMEQVDAK